MLTCAVLIASAKVYFCHAMFVRRKCITLKTSGFTITISPLKMLVCSKPQIACLLVMAADIQKNERLCCLAILLREA